MPTFQNMLGKSQDFKTERLYAGFMPDTPSPTAVSKPAVHWRGVDLIPTRSASEAETAEFLAGASGWYDHEPQKSLNPQSTGARGLSFQFKESENSFNGEPQAQAKRWILIDQE